MLRAPGLEKLNSRAGGASCAIEFAGIRFAKSLHGAAEDGAVIRYRMLAGRESFGFEAYYYSRATYETTLHRAGFTRLQWHELVVDPAGIEAMGADYFRAYLAQPPVIGLSCRRG